MSESISQFSAIELPDHIAKEFSINAALLLINFEDTINGLPTISTIQIGKGHPLWV